MGATEGIEENLLGLATKVLQKAAHSIELRNGIIIMLMARLKEHELIFTPQDQKTVEDFFGQDCDIDFSILANKEKDTITVTAGTVKAA